MRRLLIILIALVLVSVPVVGVSATDQRIALVIGNSAYKNAPLRNPANDATDMAIMLKRLGFKVTLKTNATRRTMQSSIKAFGKKLRSGGVGLFYYAGHGVQVDGSNYLIPVKANIEFKADVEYDAVDAGRILSYMEDAGNGVNIIILDACRNNPYSRSFRSSVNGLVKMDAPRGSVLAYSTAPGSVAADGTGRNGLYTSKLLKYMATPNLRIETIFKKVRIDVVKDSGKKQTPWESSSLMGDFYFHSDNTKASRSARAISVEKRQSPQNLNAEEEMWKIVQTSTSIEDFTLFLDEYPNSRFKGAARLTIQQLKRKQNAKPILASAGQLVTDPKKIAKDGDFEKLSNGVVYHNKTGLEWYVGPDEDTNWYEADTWIKDLKVAGGHWRFPSVSEIQTLYDKGKGTRNMSPLFQITGEYVWSNSVVYFGSHMTSYENYYFRGRGSKKYRMPESSKNIRVFAVRNRK